MDDLVPSWHETKLQEIIKLAKTTPGNVFTKVGPEPWNSTIMMLGFVERVVLKAKEHFQFQFKAKEQ